MESMNSHQIKKSFDKYLVNEFRYFWWNHLQTADPFNQSIFNTLYGSYNFANNHFQLHRDHH